MAWSAALRVARVESAAGPTSSGGPGSITSPAGCAGRIRVNGTFTCPTSFGPVTAGGVWRRSTAVTRAIWPVPAPSSTPC